MLYQNYTFHKRSIVLGGQGHRWNCSSSTTNRIQCKTYLYCTNSGEIVKFHGVHNHEPPSFTTLPHGELIKLKPAAARDSDEPHIMVIKPDISAHIDL